MVAAGSGSRLGGSVPKALRELGGVPLVRRSVDQLVAGGAESVVVVIAEGLAEQFTAALDGVTVPWRLVVGGAERQQSVRLGLAVCAELAHPQLPREADKTDPPGGAVVLIHDAARPLVPSEVVAGVLAAVRAGHRAVVPAVAVIDSIRQVTDAGSHVVPRHDLVAVQTPQGFDLATVIEAHKRAAAEGLVATDDAACCEAIGLGVHLVAGSRRSMKITEPEDLVLATALLQG